MAKAKKKPSVAKKKQASKRTWPILKSGSTKRASARGASKLNPVVGENANEPSVVVGKELVRRRGNCVTALEETTDVTARFTCRTVKLDLQPKPYDAEDVKKVRQILGASQAIFAQFLGVSRGAVRDWEQG